MTVKTNGSTCIIILSEDELEHLYGQCKKDQQYLDDTNFSATIKNFIDKVEKIKPDFAQGY